MIKVFTLNKNGKIELTSKELEQLLNESYWEGYINNYHNNYWTYSSPNSYKWSSGTPYTISTSSITSSDSITIKTNLGE